jgi:hypothetical protein
VTRRVTGGTYLLLADEGKQIETFTAIYRAAPGRETYRVALVDRPAAPSVFPNDVADRLHELRPASDEAHREPQKKLDSTIHELERKADGLYASF